MSVLLQCLLQCLDNECIQMKCIRKMTSKYPYYCSAAAVPGYIMYPNWNVSKKNCLLLQCYCSAEMWAPLLQCLLQRSAHISALQHALQCLGIAVSKAGVWWWLYMMNSNLNLAKPFIILSMRHWKGWDAGNGLNQSKHTPSWCEM